MKRPARSGQGVNLALDGGIVDQGRGVMRLDPGVDDQRAAAAPVLPVDERVDALDVGRRVRPGERDPEEIAEVACRRSRCRQPPRSAGTIEPDSPGRSDRRTRRRAAHPGSNRGPSTTRTPGSTTRGLRKPSGKLHVPRAARQGNSLRLAPAAAITTFDPWFRPSPE